MKFHRSLFSHSQIFGFYSEVPGRPLEDSGGGVMWESDIMGSTFWKDNSGCGMEKRNSENGKRENGGLS